MSWKNGRPVVRSAAWRISLWATLAFTCGTVVVFVFLDRFVASDIQRRSDAWLSGEVEVLGDVADRTPNDALYSRVVSEVAELASREVPNRDPSQKSENDSVFFLLAGKSGSLKLWVGAGDGGAHLKAIQSRELSFEQPSSIRVPGISIPYRVASAVIHDGSRVYLGLSERDELRVLRKLRIRFFLLWLSLVLLGFLIVFFTSRRTLSHVRRITEAASRIGESDLKTRVPASDHNDEIAQLAFTLNRMLDRIESGVHQLHTITDSLAHDLRSPITAIRGTLESSLEGIRDPEQAESIVLVIDELDRLSDFLSKSLDVAEAKADALRLDRTEIDLDELLRAMVGLYEPSIAERGLRIEVVSGGRTPIMADQGLIHRMIANLFDNELKHVRTGSIVTIKLESTDRHVRLVMRDNGGGLDPELVPRLFSERAKGKTSDGHGLGLAFVGAVVRAHGGEIAAENNLEGGAQITIVLPRSTAVATRLAEQESKA